MEIKMSELYEKLISNDQSFYIELEKILNKNFTLFELDLDTNEYVKVNDYYSLAVFVEEDELGFEFGKEYYERVYLNNTDIIKIN